MTGSAGAAWSVDPADPWVGGLTSSAGRRLDPVGRTGPGEFGLIRLDRGLDHRRGPAGRECAGAGGAPETRSGEELMLLLVSSGVDSTNG